MSTLPIAFILPDLGGGGAQKVMLTIAGGLDPARFAPRILVAGGSQAFAGRLPPHVPVEIGGAARLRDSLPWMVSRLRALEPAAVVTVMGYLNLMLLGMRRFIPRRTSVVIREANTVASTVAALPRWLPSKTLYRRLYPLADAIVSPTAVIGEEISGFSPLCKPLVRIIPNPVDVETLRVQAEPLRRQPGPGLRLVSAGRLTHQKGYDRLLELMAQGPGEAHLTIFGEGEDRGRLEAQASGLGVRERVAMPGFSHEVPSWIAGADALLLPSRWEGLPNVVLESLALGTPVIASDEAAVHELATATSSGALTIRPVDQSFVAAMEALRVAPAEIRGPRPSLLPPMYEKCATVAAWESLLESLTTSPRGQR